MASRRPGRILASMRRPAEQHPDDPLYDLAPIAPDPAAPAPARASKLSRAIALGPFWVAVFKLAAVSVAPGATVALLTPALNFIPLGAILGWIGEFALYFALLGVFFDLDESDTWYCVCVIFLLNLGVYF